MHTGHTENTSLPKKNDTIASLYIAVWQFCDTLFVISMEHVTFLKIEFLERRLGRQIENTFNTILSLLYYVIVAYWYYDMQMNVLQFQKRTPNCTWSRLFSLAWHLNILSREWIVCLLRRVSVHVHTGHTAITLDLILCKPQYIIYLYSYHPYY